MYNNVLVIRCGKRYYTILVIFDLLESRFFYMNCNTVAVYCLNKEIPPKATPAYGSPVVWLGKR